MPIPAAVLREARASPWPFPKGRGHLHVKWRNGVERNKRVLSEVIGRGEFTAAEALHRMTEGMLNSDGTPNGPRRPTLAMKWGPGGMACVRQPAHIVDAHVHALRQHCADMVAAELSRRAAASSAAAVDLTADSDDDHDEKPPPRAALPDDYGGSDAASLALALRLQAEADVAFASELAASREARGAAGPSSGSKRRQAPAAEEPTAARRRRIRHGSDPDMHSIQTG